MVGCAMSGCKSNNNKRLKTNDGSGTKCCFFRFPKKIEMAQLWKLKCERSDNFNIENARICMKHFVPDDYIKSLKHRLLGYSPTRSRKLKDDAVPSRLNLPEEECSLNIPCSSRQLRADVRNRKIMINELLMETTPIPDENLDCNLPATEIIVQPVESESQNKLCAKNITSLELEVAKLKSENEKLKTENQKLTEENCQLKRKLRYKT